MIKKVLVGLFAFLGIVLLALIILPFAFRDKIAATVKEEMSKSINARINVGNVDLSIVKNFHNFPNITLSIENLEVIGKDQFYKDTLLQLKSLDLALNILSVIKNEKPIKIYSIGLDEANIHAIIDRQGKANWDIYTSKEESASSPWSLSLKSLNITDANIRYSDYVANNFVEIKQLNHRANGDFTQDVFDYAHQTTMEELSVKQNGIAYLSKAKFAYEGALNIQQKEHRYGVKNNTIKLNDLGLMFDGWIMTKENGDMSMDISFKADQTAFKSILSLLPAIYAKDFASIQTSGSFNLKGFAKGLYKKDWYPNFQVEFDINEGRFQYPSLPVAVSKVNIKSKITNPGGALDKTVISIPVASMMVGAEPIAARLYITTPISNPAVDLSAKGKINLSNVVKFYPLTPGTKISGLTNIDLAIKTSLSDVQLKRYDRVKALGFIQMVGFVYESKDIPKPVQIAQFEMKFSPNFVQVTQCKTKIGNSDFDFTGRLDNLIGYALAKREVLTGTLNLKSNYIDANEFLPDTAESKNAKSMQTSDEYFKVPVNINISGIASINRMKYDNLNITAISGSISAKDESAVLNATKANLLGGNMQLNGVYSTKNGDKPTGSLTYNITSFDMKQVFDYVESAKKLAPIMQYVQGKFSSDMNINTKINADMSPDLSSMSGTAKFSIPSASVVNAPILNNIASLTKLSQLSNLSMENTVVNMEIQNGRVKVAPFNIKAGTTNMVVSGSQGIDQSLDYKVSIDVPWKDLGAASGAVDKLLQKSPIAGFTNNLKPEVIRLNLNVGGFFNKPSITMGKPEALKGNGSGSPGTVQEAAAQQVENIKEQVKEKVQVVVDSAKTRLEQKAVEVKKQAETKIEEQKTKLLDQFKKKLPW